MSDSAVDLLLSASGLVLFSIAGVLTRISFFLLTEGDAVPQVGLWMSNMLASLILGFASTGKVSAVLKKYGLLYPICSAYCGSLSSFSTWILLVISPMVQIDPFKDINGAERAAWLVDIFLVGVFAPIGSHVFGKVLSSQLFGQAPASAADFAKDREPFFRELRSGFLQPDAVSSATRKTRIIRACIASAMATLAVLVLVCVPVFTLTSSTMLQQPSMFIALITAPVGAGLRHFLSVLSSVLLAPGRFAAPAAFGAPSWPGTFTANTIACCISAIVIHWGLASCDITWNPFNRWSYGWPIGIIWGLCGAMSTFSTFVKEFDQMVGISAAVVPRIESLDSVTMTMENSLNSGSAFPVFMPEHCSFSASPSSPAKALERRNMPQSGSLIRVDYERELEVLPAAPPVLTRSLSHRRKGPPGVIMAVLYYLVSTSFCVGCYLAIFGPYAFTLTPAVRSNLCLAPLIF